MIGIVDIAQLSRCYLGKWFATRQFWKIADEAKRFYDCTAFWYMYNILSPPYMSEKIYIALELSPDRHIDGLLRWARNALPTSSILSISSS